MLFVYENLLTFTTINRLSAKRLKEKQNNVNWQHQ